MNKSTFRKQKALEHALARARYSTSYYDNGKADVSLDSVKTKDDDLFGEEQVFIVQFKEEASEHMVAEILKELLEKGVLPKESCGLAVKQHEVVREVEVSRVWDPDEISITDSRGDWKITREKRTFLEDYYISSESVKDGGDKACYKKESASLIIPINLVGTSFMLAELKGGDGSLLQAFCSEGEWKKLEGALSALSKVEPLSPGDMMKSKLVSAWKKAAKKPCDAVTAAVKESGVDQYLEAAIISEAVGNFTGFQGYEYAA